MRSCVHMCDKARVITLITTGFMIIVIVKFYQHHTLKMWHLYAIFFLSVFLCVLPALMCWTWSFYNIFNITPQGLTTQTTSLTMRERERGRDEGMWGEMALNYQCSKPICLPLPIFAMPPRAYKTTYTNTPTHTNQETLYLPNFTLCIPQKLNRLDF